MLKKLISEKFGKPLVNFIVTADAHHFITYLVGSYWVVAYTIFLLLATGWQASFDERWWLWVDRIVYLATLWITMLVQASQNRDTKAMQIKLNKIIEVLPGGNEAVGIEKASDKDLDKLDKLEGK